MSAARRPRAVLLVSNAAAPYSRGLRVARSLAAAGYEVEIAAMAEGSLPLDEQDGDIRIRRYRPRGPWVRRAAVSDEMRKTGATRYLHNVRNMVARTVFWPIKARPWWAALERDLPPADLYHAFGILAVDVANRLAARARDQGFAGRVVYDVIDVILDSNNYDRVPAPVLWFFKWRERRWVRRADAVVTVNDPIAEYLVGEWRLPARPTVLLNCQPRWTPPSPRPDHIRAATGIPPERRVVLWLGRLGKDRGLEQARDAVLRVEDAALVMLGFGPWADQLRALDSDPRYLGRHYTLPAVHPDQVPDWTTSADVSVIAVPANSLNQRLSTPNKFWESLTAGTPIVLGRDLEVMREILERDDLGRTADPADAASLADALREVLDQGPGELAAMRERCLRVTRDTYNWETAVVPYLELVARLVPPRPAAPGA